ncbi:lipopolysaccharide biosynthesis protein [Dorea formicigenerans]|uniref:lipopolysaccharide biosynthesis protein n=1 Tax=Dorea formicigenerans TaxID=39486 RepID=UPI00157074C7|nr:lipopolysaccharide biosynthesis protein [Dorea formicigenerans]NSE47216.1 lipopolysaccharide biosynthesis protein [Dorea formicigenerans]
MNNKRLVVSGLFWRFLERFGAQAVSFVVSVVLARLLDPDIYGTVAIVTVIMTILQVFIDSGLGNALIQKKDADDLDFSTVFVFNVIFSVALYLVMFLIAPIIAKFYGINQLVPVVRVLSLTLVFSGVKNVQQAYVSRHMQFKRFFFATLGGTIGAAVVGIVMAYCGLGVWALVGQYIFNGFVDTFILWLTGDWKPKWKFSYLRFKQLFSYGWKLLGTSLLNTIYMDLTQLAVGKIYAPADLALYNRGRQYPGLLVISINSSIESVSFPAFSKVQDDIVRLKEMTRWAIKIGFFIMAPAMLGLACVAEPVVRLMLTDKWIGCVFYLRVYCVIYMFMPIVTTNINAIKAMGKSKLVLQLEVIKKIISISILFIMVGISIKALVISMLLISIVDQVVNSWPNKKILNYSYFEQIKDIFPSLFLAMIMVCAIYPIQFLPINDVLVIALQLVSGVIVYVIGAKIMKNDCLDYVLRTIKNKGR